MAKQTLGAARVRADFNPTKNDLVSEIKEAAADLIDLCETQLKGREPRLAALAQTAFEEGAMWAVKAATAPE